MEPPLSPQRKVQGLHWHNQGKGRVCREVRIGQGGRGRAQGGERPMAPPPVEAKFKGSAAFLSCSHHPICHSSTCLEGGGGGMTPGCVAVCSRRRHRPRHRPRHFLMAIHRQMQWAAGRKTYAKHVQHPIGQCRRQGLGGFLIEAYAWGMCGGAGGGGGKAEPVEVGGGSGPSTSVAVI